MLHLCCSILHKQVYKYDLNGMTSKSQKDAILKETVVAWLPAAVINIFHLEVLKTTPRSKFLHISDTGFMSSNSAGNTSRLYVRYLFYFFPVVTGPVMDGAVVKRNRIRQVSRLSKL
jgi:hypothetical protein